MAHDPIVVFFASAIVEKRSLPIELTLVME